MDIQIGKEIKMIYVTIRTPYVKPAFIEWSFIYVSAFIHQSPYSSRFSIPYCIATFYDINTNYPHSHTYWQNSHSHDDAFSMVQLYRPMLNFVGANM